MSGEVVLAYLLANYAPLTALVNGDNIVTGELPEKTQLPGLGIEEVDSMKVNLINVNETPRQHRDRVQVTALCKGPRLAGSSVTGRHGVRTLLRLILDACPNQYATVNGIKVLSITPEIQTMHPFDEVDEIHAGSRDFLVEWGES